MALPILAYGLVVMVVNDTHPMPSPAVIRDGRLSAASWLVRHRDEVLNDANPILWSMVSRSAELTNDLALKELVDDYRSRYMLPRIWDPFRQLFGLAYPHRRGVADGLEGVQDYQAFFLYALTCAPELSALPRIAAQQNAGFCPENQPLRPACTTHQVMGLRLAEEFGCLVPDGTSAVRATLVNRMERQLFWDVRLVDTYIQRALMLTEERGASGAGSAALRNVLRARMPDGGWSRSHPFVPMGRGKWFGVTEAGFGLVEKRGQFHATAQVLLLLSLVEAGLEGRA